MKVQVPPPSVQTEKKKSNSIHIRPKSPEKSRNLTQGADIIPKENSLAVEETFTRTVSHNAIKGSDKKVLDPGERVLSYPYSVSLGSFRTLKRVQRVDSIYRKMGLSPYWIKVDLGDKGVWFRVFTGYFKNKEEAEAFIKENQIPEARPKYTKYATLIGTYKSEVELKKNRLGLLKLGYCPYIIDGINGEYRLYSGVFYQKTRAEKHSAELASKGFHSQVVER
jgi:cell division septation protein DedD